jgi:hypothetical protein
MMKSIYNSVGTAKNSLQQKRGGLIHQSLCTDVPSAAFDMALYFPDILPYQKQKVEVNDTILGNYWTFSSAQDVSWEFTCSAITIPSKGTNQSM